MKAPVKSQSHYIGGIMAESINKVISSEAVRKKLIKKGFAKNIQNPALPKVGFRRGTLPKSQQTQKSSKWGPEPPKSAPGLPK